MNMLPENELFSAYLDGELSAEERAKMERLLATSAEARQLLEELRALSSTLKSLPAHQLQEDLTPQVLRLAERRMLSEPVEPSQPQDVLGREPLGWRGVLRRFLRRRTLLWPAVAAAVALALLVAERRGADKPGALKLAKAPPVVREEASAEQPTIGPVREASELAADQPAARGAAGKPETAAGPETPKVEAASKPPAVERADDSLPRPRDAEQKSAQPNVLANAVTSSRTANVTLPLSGPAAPAGKPAPAHPQASAAFSDSGAAGMAGAAAKSSPPSGRMHQPAPDSLARSSDRDAGAGGGGTGAAAQKKQAESDRPAGALAKLSQDNSQPGWGIAHQRTAQDPDAPVVVFCEVTSQVQARTLLESILAKQNVVAARELSQGAESPPADHLAARDRSSRRVSTLRAATGQSISLDAAEPGDAHLNVEATPEQLRRALAELADHADVFCAVSVEPNKVLASSGEPLAAESKRSGWGQVTPGSVSRDKPAGTGPELQTSDRAGRASFQFERAATVARQAPPQSGPDPKTQTQVPVRSQVAQQVRPDGLTPRGTSQSALSQAVPELHQPEHAAVASPGTPGLTGALRGEGARRGGYGAASSDSRADAAKWRVLFVLRAAPAGERPASDLAGRKKAETTRAAESEARPAGAAPPPPASPPAAPRPQ